MHSVLVVIVNYRVGALCVDLLASLQAELAGKPGCRAVVVDNASGDGSDAAIADAIADQGWQDWVTLLRSPVNGGYAAGNNLAIRPALASDAAPDYVMLLNPDTVIRPGALETLWRFLEEHPQAGIAGSRLEHPDGTQQHSRFRFPNFWGEVDYLLGFGPFTRLVGRRSLIPPLAPLTEAVDWLAGASMMIRCEVFERIGLLDEAFFMYFEETDFCLRARRAGWSCWYVAESRVVHLVGRSSHVDVDRSATSAMPAYWFRSRRRYWVKNHGLFLALLVDCAAVCADLLRRLRLFVQRQPDRKPRNFTAGVLRMGLSRGLPQRPARDGAGDRQRSASSI